MIEQNTVVSSPTLARAWLHAIVEAYGTSDVVKSPEDCTRIVQAFERIGVPITMGEANSFWSAYSESLGVAWSPMSRDCIVVLDTLAEEIQANICPVQALRPLRGTIW